MSRRTARPALAAALVAALALAPALTSCGSSDSDGAATTTTAAGAVTTPTIDLDRVQFDDQTGKKAVIINAVDNNFEPQYIEVSPGTTVTFRNDGRNSHNVVPIGEHDMQEIKTEDFEPGTDVEVKLGQSATFDEPGDYRYYCTLHGTTNKGMVGAVRVVEP